MSFSESINGFFTLSIGGFAIWSPLISLLIISLFLAILNTLIYKYTTNQELMKSLKEDIKKLQEEMKSFKNDTNKMMEKNKEIMEKNMQMMKQSFKPMIYTLIPFGIIFFGLRNIYEPFGKIIFGLSWIWIYVISSFILSIILRKIFKVH